MGGLRTAVSEATTDVFLESAYFAPDALLGRARRLGLQTDASQRFERGVDPTQQGRAIERAIALLTPVAGGTAGPVEVTQSAPHLPQRPAVPLRAQQLTRLLGVELPAHRFDIGIEADLIEEVARVVGFEAIPETDARVPQRFRSLPEEHPPEAAVLGMLAAHGYEEAITLAFVDPVLQERLFPGRAALALSNPIASDLSVMRVSLWPGLLRAALENQRRQADRIRLFEHGTRFEMSGGTREIDTLAGLACGARLPEQWGVPKDMRAGADFYDMKGDLAALFAATGARQSFRFEPDSQPALHPVRKARVVPCGQSVGWLGELE